MLWSRVRAMQTETTRSITSVVCSCTSCRRTRAFSDCCVCRRRGRECRLFHATLHRRSHCSHKRLCALRRCRCFRRLPSSVLLSTSSELFCVCCPRVFPPSRSDQLDALLVLTEDLQAILFRWNDDTESLESLPALELTPPASIYDSYPRVSTAYLWRCASFSLDVER